MSDPWKIPRYTTAEIVWSWIGLGAPIAALVAIAAITQAV